MQEEKLIIIGAGVAGLTASLYAARAKLNPLVLEKSFPGGQAATTYMIENYPGFPEGISGPKLISKIQMQAERFGARIETKDVKSLNFNTGFEIETDTSSYTAKCVIIASGCKPFKLGIPGETELLGRGVSYCATCDGAFFRDKHVAVIGGGEAAVTEALFLTKFASMVSIVHRRLQFRAGPYLASQAKQHKKVSLVLGHVPTNILGKGRVKGLRVRNVKTAAEQVLDVEGVFFYVGWRPELDFLQIKMPTDPRGFIETDEWLNSGTPGLFIAGDVRSRPLKQIVTAASEGAIAAVAAEHFIENL